ncbi:MalY/PatB family protein [Microbacterium caowuchunii]|uniref:cysteine-S-conjugate beta-lyase n=1 Tax=Microbacterium caowuchunii TaxID=2614638 RepID=A0A5N0TJ95_9MICO|nr:aminotransferase class I/II-fold pyridoxal phosphate-dependent enzyme [Microbacterium caowuchunii]KAA9135082.1 aminotransferase class I/II-fold pyridoxal phosphate-dependent enzyme [Microbacterium caowuchunii]
MTTEPLRALPLDQLRQRTSAKWRTYPDDVLPLFVAETDFPLAPAITRTLEHAVALGDTGYTSGDSGVREAYAAFAERRFSWSPDPARMRTTADVSMGNVEILRRVVSPGDRVVVTPPVYPPFYDCVAEAGAEVERVPLRERGDGWELDLLGIEAAFAGGARAILLCNPHNPTGTAHSRESLAALADIAARFGATVVSDEIHAPLARKDAGFTPFLAASDVAARVGFTVTSASKAFNLAGLKCAVMVAADGPTSDLLRGMPEEVEWRTGSFGAMAAVAAFAPESDAWLDSLIAAIDENARLLADLLARHVPGARYRIPPVGYLAWVDLSALGWGPNPAARILRDARVALHYGPAFGEGGAGHVRFNLACSPEVLTEAVERIGALVTGDEEERV